MRQKIAGLLILTIMAALLTPLGVFAAEQPVGYRIDGDVQSNEIAVSIYIQNINALSGYFALRYDTEQLSLKDSGDLLTAVKKGSGVTISAAGHALSELISQEEGFVCFTWYPEGARLNAMTEDQLVGTVRFELKPGVSASDFNSNTIEMRFMEQDNPLNWNTGAWIRGEGLVDYRNNVDGVRDCEVTFDYPGSTKAGSKTRTVEVTVCGTNENALSGAEVRIGTEKFTSGTSGLVSAKLKRGSHSYKLSKDGYEEKAGTLMVGESGLKQSITLRTDKELVQDVMDSLKITYAQGDSAKRVTKDIALPTSAQQNQVQIRWTSSQPGVINLYGSVFPASKPIEVTLKAEAARGDAKAAKEFNVTVDVKSTESGNQQVSTPGMGATTGEGSSLRFKDLQSVPWAQEAIVALAEQGIISGTGADTFSPSERIKRGDFIALLMRGMQPGSDDSQRSTDFVDVAQNSYYYWEIARARALGIAAGTEENRFYPEAGITREDMMSLTYRALLQAGYLQQTQDTDSLKPFGDAGQVSAYARIPAAALVYEQLIHGDGMLLHPKDNTTRAETAVFLYGIYQRFL